MEIELGLVAALAVIMLGASVLNGVAGFGFALVAVAGMAVVIEPKPAIVVMSLITPVLIVTQVRYHWDFRGVARRLPPLLIGAALGAVLGTQLLIILPGYALAIALAVFALWFVIDSWRREPRTIAAATERWIAPGVGVIAGVTNGSIGASGPILGSYLIAIGLRAREFIFGISTVFAVMSAVRIISLAAAGEYTVPIVVLGLSLAVPAYLGQRLGFLLQRRLSPKHFQQAILVMLFVASVYLLYSGLTDAAAELMS